MLRLLEMMGIVIELDSHAPPPEIESLVRTTAPEVLRPTRDALEVGNCSLPRLSRAGKGGC